LSPDPRPVLHGYVGVALAVVVAFSCKSPSSSSGDPLDTPASPQAKAEPAPLANIPAQSNGGAGAAPLTLDGGSPPTPLRGDRPVAADPPPRDNGAYELLAVLRPSDIPGPPKGPDINVAGFDAARKKTDAVVSIDFTATRARIVLTTGGFVLPSGTELRARVDRYGHVVLNPDGTAYRVAAPGTLRALLGERRLDVAPLSGATLESAGDGPKRLGRPTRRVEVATRAARATFEITHLPDVGDGGALICRALLDLMNAPPSTPLCGDGDVPLHVDLRWTAPPPTSTVGHPSRVGLITFDAFALARRADISAQVFATPPASAAYEESLPDDRALVLLTPAELTTMRTTAPDAPGVDAGPTPTLALVNSTDELRFVWLDGIPIAWLAPGARESIRTLARGRYSLQWRTFLGDAIDAPQTVTLPATSDVGGAEAGAAL